jgi:hypothetical protein
VGKRRSDSDEWWVLDLCDQGLGVNGRRHYRFDWLLGDRSAKTGRRAALPVDGYWEELGLVVEFAERQHDEARPFFDKPERVTVSGVYRGLQRRLYDERRKDLVPKNGLVLVVIPKRDFRHHAGKLVRDREAGLEVVRRYLAEVESGRPPTSSSNAPAAIPVS